MTGDLISGVRQLLREAQGAAARARVADLLGEAAVRLDEPLRVAVVGRVKAGKSTLVNALVGDDVAETDAVESTQVVTWYRHGSVPRAVVHPRGGPPEQRPFDRATGPFRVDLGRAPDEVERLELTVASERLRDFDLIDTPGLASLTDAGARTVEFLESGGERPPQADAAVYLLRHVHADDLGFLEAFKTDELVQGTLLNTVGVLGRADEIGSCRLDAMDVAEQVAARYSADPRLRRLCPVVVPVAGLLAGAGATWREDEFRALARLATGPVEELVGLLLSAESWTTAPTSVAVTPMERTYLLERLGLFGVRLGVHLIRTQQVRDGASLGRQLSASSGIGPLRRLLTTQFLFRSEAIKARSAMAVLDAVLRDDGCHGADRLSLELDALLTSAHEFVEMRQLDLIRAGLVRGNARELAEVERLLGGSGNAPPARLGLPPDASATEVRAAGYAALTRCRELAEQGRSESLKRACVAAARSCEGLLHDLESGADEAPPVAEGGTTGWTAQSTTEQSSGSRASQ